MCSNLFTNLSLAIAIAICLSNSLHAQDKPDGCVQWKTYTDTVWTEQDITENRVINETSYETKEVTKSRPRWVSEKLERTITEEKPVEKTSERTVTRTVRKPITTTKSRIKTRVIESYEDVTEMREETYTVRKPVVETVIKKEQVLVRKPVTKRSVKKEEVTVYRPQQSTQTTMVPGTLLVPGQAQPSRPQVRWLQRGYYGDPVTGQRVWRRPGLHWVDQPQYGQQAVPVIVPQQQSSTTLVPQTIIEEKPVEETVYVNEYETREVPTEVERIVEETRTRKVPYTKRIPKREVIEEEIPYTETTYVNETITEKVPVTETVMQTVTRKEPYTRVKEMWENYTETIRVPKTTSKRVPYVARYRVPYLVEVRVPCDANGRPVGRGQQIAGSHRPHPNWKKMMTKVADSSDRLKSTSETSVFETLVPSAAEFDVPDGIDAPASASSVLAGSVVNERVPGDAPKDLKFTSRSLKPIVRASAEPAVKEPEETEASKELARKIKEQFSNFGVVSSDDEKEAEAAEMTETSIRTTDSVPPPSAEVEFTPVPLLLDVEVPAGAARPNEAGTDAENSDDDTIEADVDISGPSRS